MTDITVEVGSETFTAEDVLVIWDCMNENADVWHNGECVIEEIGMEDIVTLRDVLSAVITKHSASVRVRSKTGLENFLDARGRVLG